MRYKDSSVRKKRGGKTGVSRSGKGRLGTEKVFKEAMDGEKDRVCGFKARGGQKQMSEWILDQLRKAQPRADWFR